MSDDFAPLDEALHELAAGIAPESRRKLAREISTDLRSVNAKRIKANVTPEGEPMLARKGKPRRLRETDRPLSRREKMGAMFQRAGAAQFLRRQSNDGEAQVGYAGAMARIMRVHQYGLRDTVMRDSGSPTATYAERPIIGLPAEDRARVLDKVMAQIEN